MERSKILKEMDRGIYTFKMETSMSDNFCKVK